MCVCVRARVPFPENRNSLADTTGHELIKREIHNARVGVVVGVGTGLVVAVGVGTGLVAGVGVGTGLVAGVGLETGLGLVAGVGLGTGLVGTGVAGVVVWDERTQIGGV